MNCELLLLTNESVESIASKLYELTSIHSTNTKKSQDEDGIYIPCAQYSLIIQKDDATNILFYEEAYNLRINNCVTIQLFGKTFDQGLAILFTIFGDIAKTIAENMLFIENGEFQVFRKQQNKLIINTDLDEYREVYFTDSLFSNLDYPYEQAKL